MICGRAPIGFRMCLDSCTAPEHAATLGKMNALTAVEPPSFLRRVIAKRLSKPSSRLTDVFLGVTSWIVRRVSCERYEVLAEEEPAASRLRNVTQGELS
jgi:hypothetical protein